jgi:cardiolipin synthase A/B
MNMGAGQRKTMARGCKARHGADMASDYNATGEEAPLQARMVAGGPGFDGSFTIEGNALSIIAAGPELRAALILLIEGAREQIKLFYYIFAADESGAEVRDALVRARRRGIAVTLMIDAFGSSSTPDSFFAALREAGGDVAWFGSGWSTRYLIRNHQKMAIADDARVLIGGFNVSDAYFGLSEENCWHDLGLLLEGPEVAPLVHWYAQLWGWVRSDTRRYFRLRAMIRAWKPGEGTFRWLIGGPTNRLSPWARRVQMDLETARRLDMVAAYFTPGQRMLRRIEQVARRAKVAGEGARLVLASKSDNSATIAASRLLYGPLVRRGVRIFEYQPCRLHMKLLVIDDAVYIGSANFDMRSLFLNLELMLRIENASFAQAMREFIDGRAAQSCLITREVLEGRKRPWRLVQGWISYFLVAVLDYTVTRKLNFRDTLESGDQP